jgi:hypothetical protein
MAVLFLWQMDQMDISIAERNNQAGIMAIKDRASTIFSDHALSLLDATSHDSHLTYRQFGFQNFGHNISSFL